MNIYRWKIENKRAIKQGSNIRKCKKWHLNQIQICTTTETQIHKKSFLELVFQESKSRTALRKEGPWLGGGTVHCSVPDRPSPGIHGSTGDRIIIITIVISIPYTIQTLSSPSWSWPFMIMIRQRRWVGGQPRDGVPPIWRLVLLVDVDLCVCGCVCICYCVFGLSRYICVCHFTANFPLRAFQHPTPPHQYLILGRLEVTEYKRIKSTRIANVNKII